MLLQAPENKLLHGRLLGYEIIYKRVNSTDDELKLYDITSTSVNLTNLRANTSYEVSISAYNSKGSGPLSQRTTGFTYGNG